MLRKKLFNNILEQRVKNASDFCQISKNMNEKSHVSANRTVKRFTYGGDLYSRLEQLQSEKLELRTMLAETIKLQQDCLSQIDMISEQMDELQHELNLVPEDLLKDVTELNLSFIDRAKLLILNDRLDAANQFSYEVDDLIETMKAKGGGNNGQ